MNHWNNKSQKQWTNRQTSKATHQTVHSSNQQINKLANHRIQRIWGCEFGKNQSLWCFYFFCLMWLMWKSSERSKQHLSWTQFADHQNCYFGFLHCPVNHEDAFQLSTKKWSWHEGRAELELPPFGWKTDQIYPIWDTEMLFQWSLTLELLSLAILLNDIFWEVWRPFNV